MKKIPVIAILGHIDHGKSSLLEAIKKGFKITEKESGGITQHIGAYEVEFEKRKITFLDTPGHEAFCEMRSRGAKVADVAILVVAADEGVKPQTKEAIKVILKTKTPMIVALNKIDKEGADSQRVKGEIQGENVLIEEWGGDVPVVEVSAKTGKGIKDLLANINILTDVLELKSNLKKNASGIVIESNIDSLRGSIATLIIEEGALKKGNIIGTKTSFGKIKRLKDFHLEEIEDAISGQACVVTGFVDVPGIGERFFKFDSLEEAKDYTKKGLDENEEEKKETECDTSEGNNPEKFLNIILKTDVKGTHEVLSKILKNLVQGTVGIKILKSGIGNITDSDVRLAKNLKANIIGFRVEPTIIAKTQILEDEKIISIFDIIYDLIDDVRKKMESIKEEKEEKINLAKMNILAIFKTKKRGEKKYRQVIGGKILEGEMERASIEIQRDSTILSGGKIIEIQEQKKKIKKAKKGTEVGILYEGKTKIKEGDILSVFKIVKV